MSLILNFVTEISVIKGNPQIRIDDVEAESCLNVTAMITCPNNLRLIINMQIRDMCSVWGNKNYKSYSLH
jgi:hypothetical protein